MQGLEWIVILVIVGVLFIFGPKKIPEIMRSMGRAMGEFRRGRLQIESELKKEFMKE